MAGAGQRLNGKCTACAPTIPNHELYCFKYLIRVRVMIGLVLS